MSEEKPPYVVKLVEDKVDIEMTEKGGGMTVPVKDLCSLAGIEFTQQDVRITKEGVEIDPPNAGESGATIPIETIVDFYKP